MPTEFDDLLRSPALLRAVLEFNGLAAPDEGAAESDPLLAQLSGDPRVWRFLCARTPEATIWCFGSKPNRLALLPPPLLDRLLSYWSAAVWAEDLSRIIEKTRLTLIMERIGTDVYRYAVRRGRFQLGELRTLFRHERNGENLATDTENWLANTFSRPGDEMLALCLAHWPETLRAAWGKRWQRTVPENLRQDAASFATAWRWLEKILLSEVAPEWQPCFNS
jgi:hypothetical protein